MLKIQWCPLWYSLNDKNMKTTNQPHKPTKLCLVKNNDNHIWWWGPELVSMTAFAGAELAGRMRCSIGPSICDHLLLIWEQQTLSGLVPGEILHNTCCPVPLPPRHKPRGTAKWDPDLYWDKNNFWGASGGTELYLLKATIVRLMHKTFPCVCVTF